MKKDVEDATENANTAAGLANEKAALAATEAQRAKGYNDHPWEIGDDGFIYVWNETYQSVVKTNKMILEFNDLTEQQKQSLIDEFYATLTFASIQTCEDIIDEIE